MGTSWGQPNDQRNTPAEMQSQFRLNEYSIAPLVAAIIAHKDRQAQAMSQGIESLGKSVGGAIGNYQQNQDADRLSQFQQIGLTDQSDQPITPEQQDLLDHMRGRAREQAMGWLQGRQQQDIGNELNQSKQNYEQSRANYYDAGANQRWMNPDGTKPMTANQEAVRAEHEAAAERKALEDTLGVKAQDFPGAIASIERYHPGDPNSKVAATPDQDFPKFGPYQEGNDTDGAVKQHLIDAVNAYRAKAGQASGAISPAVQAGAQMPVNNGAQPIAVGTQRPDPATGGTIVWDGRGWVRQ